MKIRSLLLGSVAAAGLSTGAFAADLGVLTSLDVCDSLGLSGLTISSDTNCLQITGSVEYVFKWGNYAPGALLIRTEDDDTTVAAPGGTDPYIHDWDSRVTSWIKFVATADSDFGPAKAVIKIKDVKRTGFTDEGDSNGDGTLTGLEPVANIGSDTLGAIFDEAYVQIGDSTVIMAGKKGSIANLGDDTPLTVFGLFNSENVDTGVKWSVVDHDLNGDGDTADLGEHQSVNDHIDTGGHVIQITSDLGNGVSIKAGLENLGNTVADEAGTAVGVLEYAGEGISAHLTVLAGGILDGDVENYGFHAGFSGTFDVVKVVAAVAGDNTGYWNALGSASATFDMFTLAIAGEAAADRVPGTETTTGDTDYGFGASASAAVTDGVTINVGGRWYHDAFGDGVNSVNGYQIAAQVIALVTETVTLTGEVGYFDNDAVLPDPDADTFYGAAQVAWAPGGGFTSSLKGEVYSNGAYKATFKAAKTFE